MLIRADRGVRGVESEDGRDRPDEPRPDDPREDSRCLPLDDWRDGVVGRDRPCDGGPIGKSALAALGEVSVDDVRELKEP